MYVVSMEKLCSKDIYWKMNNLVGVGMDQMTYINVWIGYMNAP